MKTVSVCLPVSDIVAVKLQECLETVMRKLCGEVETSKSSTQ